MRPVYKSLKEYGRGIVGGLLFSLPLLYTMEIWWAGTTLHQAQLVVYQLAVFLLLLMYNRYAGMRKDASWKEIAIDSVEETGLGYLLAFFILWLFGRIDFYDMKPDEIISRTTVEAMTVAIGISIGTSQLGDKDTDTGTISDEMQDKRSYLFHLTEHFFLSVCGGILIGSNIAPTMEIVVIGIEISAIHSLIVVLISLLLTISILYYLNFRGTQQLEGSNKFFRVTYAACISYSLALISSAFMLWFFGRFSNNSLYICLNLTIVLGLATTLGASAGRLLLK